MAKLFNYRCSFVWNGKNMWDYVTAPNQTIALQIVRQRYPGCTSWFLTEERN